MIDAELNPYRSPTVPSLRIGEPSRYLGLNSTKLTLRETWRLSTNFLIYLILVFYKAIGVRLPAVIASDPSSVLLRLEQISERAREQINQYVAVTQEIGYYLKLILGTPILGRGEIITAVFQSEGKNSVLCVDYSFAEIGGYENEQLRPAFSTLLVDGTHVVTSSAKPQLDLPEQTQAAYLPGASLSTLLARHEERISRQPIAVEPVQTVDDCEALVRWVDTIHYDFLQKRGVMEPISDQEFLRLSTAMTEIPPVRLPAWLRWLDLMTWTLGLLVAWISLSGETPFPATWSGRMLLSLVAMTAIVVVTVVKQLVRSRMRTKLA